MRIDYCNAILVGLPDVTLLPLQRVMNAAARFVADLGPRDHISQTMRELHWLPIRQRIDFKLATIMQGIVHGSAPEYLRNKVTPVSDLPGRRHLRSAAHGLFHVPRIRTRHGSRAFSVAGPTVWNSLPQTIRNISSVVTFKKQLKTHLFNLIYNVWVKFETLFSIEFYCKGPLFNFVRGAALQNILIHDFSVRVINVSNKIK